MYNVVIQCHEYTDCNPVKYVFVVWAYVGLDSCNNSVKKDEFNRGLRGAGQQMIHNLILNNFKPC